MVARSKARQNLELAHQARRDYANNAYNMKANMEDYKRDLYASRIQALEDKEQRLVQQLKHTTSRQMNAYANLDKLVHDGYDYYLQSYNDKKNLIERRKQPSSVSLGRDSGLIQGMTSPEEHYGGVHGLAPPGSKLRELQLNQSQLVNRSASTVEMTNSVSVGKADFLTPNQSKTIDVDSSQVRQGTASRDGLAEQHTIDETRIRTDINMDLLNGRQQRQSPAKKKNLRK